MKMKERMKFKKQMKMRMKIKAWMKKKMKVMFTSIKMIFNNQNKQRHIRMLK